MEGLARLLTCASFALAVLLFVVQDKPVESSPVEKNQASLFGGPPSSVDYDKFPAMVAVSSTVIPLTHLFGKPKPIQGGNTTKAPKRSSALFLSPERRARLLERSSRPDTPVRLITKNSKQKDVNNETH